MFFLLRTVFDFLFQQRLKRMSSLNSDINSEISEEIEEEISDFDCEVENINRNALYSSVSELRPAEVPVTTGTKQLATFKVTQVKQIWYYNFEYMVSLYKQE